MRHNRRWIAWALLVAVGGLLVGASLPWLLEGIARTPAPGPTSTPATTPSASPEPSPDPTVSPTPEPVTAWIQVSTALLDTAGDPGSAEVQLGAGFPLILTSRTSTASDTEWAEVRWETPGRRGTDWVDADAIGSEPPADGIATASLGALDEATADYVRSLGDRVGVSVLDVTRATTYGYNAERPFIAASSIKVPIMLAFLSMLEADDREPTADELALLSAMIQQSDNDAATALYAAIGAEQGMAEYVASIGLEGLSPEGFVLGWGWSLITPEAMVELLGMLHRDEILTPQHRALALDLMRNPAPHLRYGVGDTAPEGATVAMKTGNVIGPDGLLAVNSSGIVTVGDATYIVAVYSDGNLSFSEGQDILRRVCAALAALLI